MPVAQNNASKTNSELIKCAKKGSPEGMGSLLEKLSAIPAVRKDAVFDVFRFHLHKPCIPRPNEESENIRANLATMSLTGICALGSPFFSNAIRIKLLVRCWMDIRRWLQFLAGRLADLELFQLMVANTITLYRGSKLAVKAILDDHEAFEMAIRLWKEDTSRRRHASLSLDIISSFFGNGTDTKVLLDIAVDCFPDGAGVATLCSHRLHSTIDSYRGPRDITALCSDINIAWLLAKEDDDYEIQLHFECELRGIETIIRALRLLVQSELKTESVVRSISHCVHIIKPKPTRNLWEISVFACSAAKVGLLQCLHELASRFQLLDKKHQKLALSIVHDVTKSLSIATVLAEVASQFKKITGFRSVVSSNGEHENEMESKLFLLEDMVLERQVLKELYDVQEKDELTFTAISHNA